VDGMKIMFIGIITSEVLAPLKGDSLLGSLVDVEDAAREVGKICNAYHTVDIDFTVLLTHIGIEEDKHLAALLDPDWGVDVIIGGHSHTILEKPEDVNGVLIVQAGIGTDQIGRFDIVIDTDNNSVESYTWELIPIAEKDCPRDKVVEEVVSRYKAHTDAKYDMVICWMARELTHPNRYQETELGNLISDAFLEAAQADIVMVGSGSIRKKVVGPIFTRRELIETMPFEEKLYRLSVSGSQFKQMYAYMLREEALSGEHTEFYQFSRGLAVEYDRAKKEFIRFDFNGKPMDPNALFTVCLQGYHLSSFDEFLGVPLAEVKKNAKPIVVSTSQQDVLEEYLLATNKIDAHVEGRLVIR